MFVSVIHLMGNYRVYYDSQGKQKRGTNYLSDSPSIYPLLPQESVPFTFVVMDAAGAALVVTLYNLSPGRGVIIGKYNPCPGRGVI